MVAVLSLLMSGLWSAPAWSQDLEIEYGGAVQADVRFGIPREYETPWYVEPPETGGVTRNQLLLKTRLDATMGRFSAHANVDLVFRGYAESTDLSGVSDRGQLDPFYIEPHALFLEGRDVGLRGLDFRIGNMIIDWGVGDRFNPTNNLNPNDVEDVLLFGDQVANLMARLDYSPTWWMTFSGVLVPVFKPSLVPASGQAALTSVDRLPFTDDSLRWRVHAERELAATLAGNRYPTVVTGANVELPDPTLRNMQWSLRAAAIVGGMDIALSYYNGFNDIPVAAVNHTVQNQSAAGCNPDDPEDCINGLLETEVTLQYPRMQVLGLNLAGEAPVFGWLHKSFKPIGFRLEAALVFPERRVIRLEQEYMDFGLVQQPAGEYAYPSGARPEVVASTPFPKWVLGLDYTFNRHLYMNTQWVHGFPDEFGAGSWIQPGWTVREGGVTTESGETFTCAVVDENGEQCAYEILKPRIGDYLVWGLDIRFLSQAALVRLFAIFDLIGVYEEQWDPASNERVRVHHNMFTPEGFTAIIYPEFQYNFGNGLEFHAGALVQVGKPYSRFGEPATGGSMIWTRAKYSF